MSRRVGGVVAAALSCVLLAPVARASPGRQSWVASYNGPASSVDEAKAAVVSPDGTRVFVTGESAGFGTNDDYDDATVAYNAATGGQLWAARYDGPAHGLDEAGGIGVAPDGSKVFVTGYVSTTGSPEAATVAYDAATGSRVWVALYDGVGHGASAGGLGVSPDGSRVYISGDSYDGPPYYLHRYATVAYDAASGSLIWATRHARPGSDQNDAGLLQVSPDASRVFVAGTTFASTAFDYTTVAYDASTGHALWASSYNGPGLAFDFPFSLAVSPDGSKVFATGYSDAPNTGDDYATVAWDAVM